LAYGGIQLKVHPNDTDRVKQILNDLNNPLSIV
jgi:flagellar biosynthesis/type III secretory pathway protein FliH